MAVVIVRVEYRMLPPSIMATPTSVMTRPNAVMQTMPMEYRHSHSESAVTCRALAPSVNSVSRQRGSRLSTACAVQDTTMGRASTACPTAMPGSVNSSPYCPSGPRAVMKA